MNQMKSINPYTGEVISMLDTLTLEQCREEIDKSRQAFVRWRQVPVEQRAGAMKKVGRKLLENKMPCAETITREMGKPIKESIAEIEKCAVLCDYYAENAADFMKPEPIETEAARSCVAYEPLGVIFGIMPWNFPFWQVFRFAVPALAAGNVCVLKHASNVPMSALNIENVFLEAGLPPYIFRTLLIDSQTAMDMIEQDLVEGVSLTGSEKAGSQVGEKAGKRIRKVVLELGGSDPFIVLDDADVAAAADMAVKARLINAGQSCIAAKRFIVMETVQQEFVEALIARYKELKVGDPMDPETDIGPLAGKQFVDELRAQLEDAKQKGAVVVVEAGKVPESGFFFRPVVLTGITQDMKVSTEEVFGPIAPVMVAKSEEQVAQIANATRFGLGASIWSRDLARAEKLAAKIQAGFVAINDMVKSDPRLPFGGVKKSGVGRELSRVGMREFVNIKTIVVNE